MRKMVLLMSILFISTIHLFAQYQKNKIFVGLGYGKHVFKYNNHTLNGTVAIGLSTNSTIGIFLENTQYDSWPSQFSDYYSQGIGFGFFYNYARYFNKISRWGWSVNSSLGLFRNNFYEIQNSVLILNNRFNQIELTITPGIFFRVSPRLLFHSNIGGASLINNPHEFKAKFNRVGEVSLGATLRLF